MKNRWILAGSLVAVLLLALAAGLTLAQGPEPPESEVAPEGGAGIEAVVGSVIPIQGRLTDATGKPIDGTFPYTVWFRIYQSSSGGTALCSISRNNLELDNGLFNTTIPCSGTFINGQQLYLGVQVGGDAEMTPRQPIYPVPYAYSLVPGADIVESVAGASILKAQNESSSNDSKGLLGVSTAASGRTYGVYGHAASPNGYGGYFENTGGGPALKAGGSGIIQSTAVSRIFVPGGEAVVGGTATSDVSLTYWGRGTVDIKTTSSGVTRTIVIPISLPAVLYGQQVRIADIRVYYKTSNASSYIAETNLYRENLNGDYYSLIDNVTPRNSTTFTYYHLYCTADECRLSDDEGFVSVRLQLYFSSNAHTITLGGVRVTLEHD